MAIGIVALVVLIGVAVLVAQQFIDRSRRTAQLYRELRMTTQERDSVSKRAAPEVISKAERLMGSQKWGEAGNAIHVASRLDKEHSDIPVVRGRLQIALGEFERAVSILEQTGSEQISSGYRKSYNEYLAIAREYSGKAQENKDLNGDDLLQLATRLHKLGDAPAAIRICRALMKDALASNKRKIALRAALFDLGMMNPTVRKLGYNQVIEEGRFELDLSTNTELRDISALRGLPLTHLNLEGCHYLKDITPLEKMPLRYLNIERTRVTRLTELQGMPLEHLVISRTQTASLHALRGLPLKKLVAQWCPKLMIIRDVASLKQLKHLDLSYSRNIDDLEALAEAKALEELRLGRTQVASIAPLKGLKLKHLNLASTFVSDITALSGMPLNYLNLEYTAVVNCAPLKKMPVKHLNLRGTDIIDLSPLIELPVKHLDLARCKKITNVSSLRNCTQIETLFVPRQARFISHMKSLPSLKYIGYDSPGLPAETFWEQHSTP
jgi:Leucine-rich repeat (LRR) protein